MYTVVHQGYERHVLYMKCKVLIKKNTSWCLLYDFTHSLKISMTAVPFPK
jgi:hypothetical protein